MAYSLYFVRHGQTYLNRYNKIQGWCDSPLTPKGIEDGHQAGKRLAHLNFAHAFHSDTNRAARTCRYILEENVASAEELTLKLCLIFASKILVTLKAVIPVKLG